MVYRILAVDDDADIRNLVSLVLQSEQVTEASHYDVVVVPCGTEALARLEAEEFHLVILDINLPGIDGWDICRKMKTRSRTRDIPVVFLSVRDQPLDRVIGVEVLHADAFLSKPFEPQTLVHTVNTLLTRSVPALDA